MRVIPPVFLTAAVLVAVYLPFALFHQASFVAQNSSAAYVTSAVGLVSVLGLALAAIAVAIRAVTAAALRPREFVAIIMVPLVLTYLSIFMFALVYRDFGLNVPSDKLSGGDYLYFSVVTWTTLGYGDLTPVGPSRFFAATEALAGYFVSGLTVSLLSSLFVRPVIRSLGVIRLVGESSMRAEAHAVRGSPDRPADGGA